MEARAARDITRRDLLARGITAAVGLSLAQRVHAGGDGAQTDAPLLRPIHASGERIPAIGLGTWQTFDVGTGAAERAPLRDVVRRFSALGGAVIDSSPMYGRAEAVVGDLVAELSLRPRLFLATKVWTQGRESGIQQMRTSLSRLHAEPIDLMQVHNLLDVETQLETLHAWKAEKRIRYVGVTHYTVGAYTQLERILSTQPLDFVQLNYSLAEREADQRLLPLAKERGVAVLVNRPFAEGGLFRAVAGRALPDWAAECGAHSWAQFFLKWIVAHPAVTCVIPATSDPHHLEDNMGALRGPLPDEVTRTRMLRLVQQS